MAGQTSFADFVASTKTDEAPAPALTPALQALWYDARGDWDAAHASAQGDTSASGAWVHAYLHRKEGDDSNAGYWYRRAGRSMPTASLEAEWTEIAKALLSRAS